MDFQKTTCNLLLYFTQTVYITIFLQTDLHIFDCLAKDLLVSVLVYRTSKCLFSDCFRKMTNISQLQYPQNTKRPPTDQKSSWRSLE